MSNGKHQLKKQTVDKTKNTNVCNDKESIKDNPNCLQQESDQSKEKTTVLYTCKSKIDVYEYKRMAKYFPQIYWSYVIFGTLANVIFSIIIAIISKSTIETIAFFISYQIFIMIIYKVRLENFAEKAFNRMQKKDPIDTNLYIEFYDNYFIRQDKTTALKINYSDVDKCIETDTNFYFRYGKKRLITIIQKDQCDLTLISFIRKKMSAIKKHNYDNYNRKEQKKLSHPNFIKNSMIILFILTILSLCGALYSVALVDRLAPQHGFNFTKNLWVFWCWLPIPILSIILGFKYKSAGFKCTKNIIGGFIISFFLLIYGSFCLLPTFSQDYNKIDDYRSIIDAKLPSNGDLEIQDWGTYFDDDKTEYTIINAYYDKENVSNLVNSIKNSDNWILSKEIKSELKILIPSQLHSDDDAYFSIYNKTTAEYNSLPIIAGDYEIYAMKYDISDKKLEIHKFKYSYK